LLITHSQPVRAKTSGFRKLDRQPTTTHTLTTPQATVSDSLSLTPQSKAAAPVPTPLSLQDEVVDLTRRLVQIDSTPSRAAAGETAVVDVAAKYAEQAGLQVSRSTTINDRPMLVVTLPGKNPELGSVGFVHHSDVVSIEGEWKTGKPFSGDIVTDKQGRDVMVGRGTIDTKGPAAQVLVAMKHLKESGKTPDRPIQLFLFPDEETGGDEGAKYLADNHPEMFKDVKYWVVEGSGIMSKESLASVGNIKTDVPYIAMAQKYSVPLQMVLKDAADPHKAISQTMEAMERLDDYVEDREWTFLGAKSETAESFKRFGETIGGFKGWMLKNLWWSGFVQKRMGAELSATNRTDMAQTDFYLSSNTSGKTKASNTKPSSTTAMVKLDLDADDRAKALGIMQKAAGEEFQVEATDEGLVRVSLPQESYDGTHHGSIADRDRDAINRTNRALDKMRKKLWFRGWADNMEVVDYFTNKSAHDPNRDSQTPVRAHLTLDLRVAADDQVETILTEMKKVVGEQFELKELGGPVTREAFVRRLSHESPLFTAAENAIHNVYGENTPVLFGNTTASNDVRHLMSLSGDSEALTFVPVLYTEHGAHGPDESVTISSLAQGVEWTAQFMELIGTSRSNGFSH
jgi:acetylornithine deacetylase/succinyl-diaminopimelate desuccinylase-like protein